MDITVNATLLPQVVSLQEEIKCLKEEIQKLKIEVKKRDHIIMSLKTDIDGLRKEIQERDETIQDKVRVIYTPPLCCVRWGEGQLIVILQIYF